MLKGDPATVAELRLKVMQDLEEVKDEIEELLELKVGYRREGQKLHFYRFSDILVGGSRSISSHFARVNTERHLDCRGDWYVGAGSVGKELCRGSHCGRVFSIFPEAAKTLPTTPCLQRTCHALRVIPHHVFGHAGSTLFSGPWSRSTFEATRYDNELAASVTALPRPLSVITGRHVCTDSLYASADGEYFVLGCVASNSAASIVL